MTQQIKLNGRIKSIRRHKNCVFMDLDSPEIGNIQVCLNVIGDDIPSRGDIVTVSGELGKSKTGQETVFLKNVCVLNRSFFPEAVNPDMKRILLIRHNIESIARKIVEEYGAISTCTNVLGNFKGTSQIRPFETKDLKNNKYFLKITHELELKRLITDTQLPVYEVGRVFRDMGQDAKHNREYKVLEAQFPYINLNQGIQIVSDVVKSIGVYFENKDFENIPSFTVREKFSELGYDIDKLDDKTKKIIHKTKIKTQPGPFFITNPPASWSPLTLLSADRKTALDADLVYKGKGISHICEERYLLDDIKTGLLNGQDYHPDADTDFLNHMMAGMPPSTGFAIGLDRITNIFLNTKHIKDIIPYSR
ncbi:MAG: hypothetical protein LBE13_15175 [Bacteroidales bacterium]|jgi:lysyl-tRNA synthetase class 2|nr:hypothetical protein [Bacteroidales bacterium]